MRTKEDLKILIGCESTAVTREAFIKRGFINTYSCDILPSEIEGNHYQCDIREVLDMGWDLMIAFPPCTHLASSGARWFKAKAYQQKKALEFVKMLMDAPIKRIAIENPVGIIGSVIRKPDQSIQPYEFGHNESKRTCLWLKRLPKLVPTNIVKEYTSKTGDKWGYNRSRGFSGIAEAMAKQWGDFLVKMLYLE